MMLEALNWSERATNFLLNAEIKSIDELARFTPRELRKFRNVGDKTIFEIRFRLAQIGRTLNGDRPPSLDSNGCLLEQLVQRRMELELELAEVGRRIAELEETKLLHAIFAPPLDEEVIYSLWKTGTSFDALSNQFASRPEIVSKLCWSRLNADCENGTPPKLDHTISRRVKCDFCNEQMVVTYRNEAKKPKCPYCGRKAKTFVG